ncbi:YhgE/Pip N-terminal domain protein [Streptococcus ictaluri 707-05]|uniref:YhgE/Pip N-terminal domain protein n=1 Tax=Streptococcus ictaluri 707-05 TaxID=764299 RepID=G5K0P6_9STRE|nr:YhgE/Pip N-terminal domain protein [Streptococcus ictaluri 707-05]
MLEELKALIKNPKLIITMIGVALVPALYNLAFLGSMWDPYGQVNHLPIAVVNKDRPTKYKGKTFEIGDNMVDKMSKNKDLDYHFVSEKVAKNGLRQGDYYMVVTLPKNLSQKATTLLEKEPEKLVVSYQTSKGHGMVASKMADTAMHQLKEKIATNLTESYIASVFKNMRHLQKGLKKASNGASQLNEGAQVAQDGSQTLTNGLNRFASSTQTFDQGASQFSNGLVSYTDGVGQLHHGLGQFSESMPSYLNGVTQLAKGANQLSDGIRKLEGATQLPPEKNRQLKA